MVPHLAWEKGSFWWKDLLRLSSNYRGIAMCIPKRGDTISFWEDLINGRIHMNVCPHLFPFAKDPRISLASLHSSDNLLDNFRIPMSRQALNEFSEL